MNINKENYIKELKRRNPIVIEFIVHEYGSLIKGIIGKYLFQDVNALDECFNDVLLAIWNNPDKFDDKKSKFINWICAIAKYRAIDTLRRQIRHNEKNIYIDNDFDWIKGFDVTNGESEIIDELSDQSLTELAKLLKCLSEEDKDLFVRRYVDEQSVDEISNDTNMSRDLIYARISRGKKKIKNSME